MASGSLKVGDRYLTVSGLPVEVLGIGGDHIELQSLASDNRLSVPKSYPLRPFRRGEPAVEMRSPYRPRVAASRRSATPKLLAPIIDAMLLADGKTMRGMVRELKRKASAACKWKDLKANVRARIYWLKRRGFTIDSDTHGRLRAADGVIRSRSMQGSPSFLRFPSFSFVFQFDRTKTKM